MFLNYAQKTAKLCNILATEEGRDAINKAMSTYPLYAGKKSYDLIPTREELNTRILDHYKYREIGQETVGRFIDELRITMNEIMPYYNELFKTVEIMSDLENPFDNVDFVETFEEEHSNKTENESLSTGEQTATTNASATSNVSSSGTSTENDSENAKRKLSDTPQNHVDNIDNYLSEYSEEDKTTSQNGTTTTETEGADTSETTSQGNDSRTNAGTSETTGTTRHTFTKKGNQGVNTYAHDMNEFRTSIIDVVDRIVHDNRIANLFLLVW